MVLKAFYATGSGKKRLLNRVKELGLRSLDDVNFYIDENFSKGTVNDLYSGIQFVNEFGKDLEDSGIIIRHRLNQDYFLGEIKLELESEEKEDWFDVKAAVRIGDFSIPFLKLKDHLLQGIREFELPDGKVAILPGEWFSRYRSMFEFGKIKGERILIHKQHFSMMDGSVREFHTDTIERLEKAEGGGVSSFPGDPRGSECRDAALPGGGVYLALVPQTKWIWRMPGR